MPNKNEKMNRDLGSRNERKEKDIPVKGGKTIPPEESSYSKDRDSSSGYEKKGRK